MYNIVKVFDHVEVFKNGIFQFSADTESEAVKELEDLNDE